MICKICNQEVKERKHFWVCHRIKESSYYEQYEPRFSKLTGKLIKFKTSESYLSNDFEDKNEMKSYFKKYPEEAKIYAVELLKRRKENKKLIYAPSSVELSSILSPSLKWYKDNFDYNKLCRDLGLRVRFVNDKFITKALIKPLIEVDTREQKRISFNIPNQIATLNYGDYRLDEQNHCGVVIEKKNISDFASSFGRDLKRIEREIIRCKKEKEYLLILVQCELNKALSFNYLPQMKWCKASSEFVFFNVRYLMQKFKNIQFLFCEEKRSSEVIIKVFEMGEVAKKTDLQELYNKGYL